MADPTKSVHESYPAYTERVHRGREMTDAPMNTAANQRMLLDMARESAMGARFAEPEPRAAQAPYPSGGVAKTVHSLGTMFSRETICAIVRGQMAITHDSHLRDLLTIFENLE